MTWSLTFRRGLAPLQIRRGARLNVTVWNPPIEVRTSLIGRHTHDSRYYTKDEVTALLSGISIEVIDTLTSIETGKPLSANQGRILKGYIDTINTLLNSDNVNLDNVQELVDAIETIQTSLATILVNDLTTGGVTKALTAEQGKVLKGLIDALPTGWAEPAWSSWELQFNDWAGGLGANEHMKFDNRVGKKRVALQAWSNPQATLQVGAKVGTTVDAPASGSNTQIVESINSAPTVTPTIHVEPRASSGVNTSQIPDEGWYYSPSGTSHSYQIYRGKVINGTLYRSQFYADASFTDDNTSQHNIGLEFQTTDTSGGTIDGDTWIIYKNGYYVDTTTSNTWTDYGQNNNVGTTSWGTYTHVSSGGGTLNAPSSIEWPSADSAFSGYTEDGRYIRYEIDSFDSTYNARSGSPVSNSIALGSNYSSLGIQIDVNSGGTQSGFVVRRQFSYDYGSTWYNASGTQDAWDYCYLYDLYYDSMSSYNFIDQNFSHNPTAETTWNSIFSGGGGSTETVFGFRSRAITTSPSSGQYVYSSDYYDYTVTISDTRNYIIEHQFSGMAKLYADTGLGIAYGMVWSGVIVDTYYTSWGYGTAKSPNHYGFNGVNQNIEYKVWALQTISGTTIESLTPLAINVVNTGGYKYNSLSWSAVSGVTNYKVQRRINGWSWTQNIISWTVLLDDALRSWWSVTSYDTAITVWAVRFERNMATLTENPIAEFVTLATAGDRYTVVGLWSATDENTPASLQAFFGHQVNTWYFNIWASRTELKAFRGASANTVLWAGYDFNVLRNSSHHFNIRSVNDNLFNTRSDMDSAKFWQSIGTDNQCALEVQPGRSGDIGLCMVGHQSHTTNSFIIRFQEHNGAYRWAITVGAHILATQGNPSTPGHAFYNDADTWDGSNGANTCYTATGGVIAMYVTSAQKVAIGNQNQSPQARLDVTEPTLGQAVKKESTVATNDDPCILTYQNRLATTNNTQTTLHTFAIPTNKTVSLDCWVIARRTGWSAGANGDSACYRLIGTYKNIGGVVTMVGTLVSVFSHEDQAWWDCTMTISGANVLLRVTGATNNNITWHLSEWKYIELGS